MTYSSSPSLQDRLAAFQDASAPRSPSAEPTAGASLTYRKAAYQRNISSGKSADGAPPTLKERMSAYADASASSADDFQEAPTSPAKRPEPRLVESRRASYQPKKETLQDRMAKYASAASNEAEEERGRVVTPTWAKKKEKKVDIKERMAAFNSPEPVEEGPAVAPSPRPRAAPKRGELQKRMSAYKGMASPNSAEDEFSVAKKTHVSSQWKAQVRLSTAVRRH